jgi:serine protease Do
MQPSRRHCLYASLALLAFCAPAQRTFAETLTITSSPPGATVEIDGIAAGTTPYHVDYPGSYFHKPHTVFTARLEHAMVLRLSMGGYLTQQITVSSGPFEWIGLSGKHHGNYFLLRSDHFEIKLEPIHESAASTMETGARAGPLPPPHTGSTPLLSETHAPGTGSVAIASDPAGAEIYIDGKFVGQTPSTIRLPSGAHRIEVKSQGKQNWQRDLEVLKDSELTLHPVLAEGQP